MTASALLAHLCRQGVQLRMTEDRSRIAAPMRVLTPEIRAALVAHKAELMRLLPIAEEYRALLCGAFVLATATRSEPGHDELQRFGDEQVRLTDELGPVLTTAIFNAQAREWRTEIGRCPWCGDADCSHEPALGEE